MAVFSATAGAVSSVKHKNPSVVNVTAPTAGVEASYTFPANTAFFRIQGKRVGFDMYWASGAADILTISCGTMYWSPQLDTSQTFTLYFKTGKDNAILQIEYWS